MVDTNIRQKETARKYAKQFHDYENSWEIDSPSQRELEQIILTAIREANKE